MTRFTALGTYTIPKIDVLVAGTARSDQGQELSALWSAPNSATVGLNRAFFGLAGQTITVNLIEPGTMYGDRINQVDLRVAKNVRLGRTRTNIGVDVYSEGEFHDTRVIPLGPAPQVSLSPAIQLYMGDARGRWEGRRWSWNPATSRRTRAGHRRGSG